MSSAQATLADRTPSILNKDPAERRQRTERPPVALKHDFDPAGLVQRCVIIQRDENGFGLTVSGDNPVFVQLVKEDGAAMRAGVQTGDRIIKVNGTLVTHSNHIEVVKLIKSGSYVALTVLGRPPGLPHIPLEEECPGLSVSPLHSPDRTIPGSPSSLSAPCSPQSFRAPGLQDGSLQVLVPAEFGDGSGTAAPGQQGDRGPESASSAQSSTDPGETSTEDRDPEGKAVKTEDITGQESKVLMAPSPPLLVHPQIIGAEDDYFEQEQINGQCSCFQSVDLLKARPAHLSVFLHHVVSQFDPAPTLCFLFSDLHKQTTTKESRRFFLEFHSLFLDRAANLKVTIPEAVASELERRRVELIPEDMCKNLTQLIQESLLPELQRLLEDFRQKRSMGLTLAEEELSKLELDQTGDQTKEHTKEQREHQLLERECCCAEGILSKIDDILMTSQPSEEEKSSSMQFVIQAYMKHLGVKVKEVKGLEHKRARINFLPKIPNKKKTVKAEKEGEEKVKKRFHNILPTPRRLSRVESTSGKSVDVKQRSPKALPQPSFPIPEQADTPNSPTPSPSLHPALPSGSSPGHTDTSEHDYNCNVSPSSSGPQLFEGHSSTDTPEGHFSPTSPFDFSPTNTEQLQEDDQDAFCRRTDPDVLSEDDQAGDGEMEESAPTWQSVVGRDILTTLTSREVERQEVINELFFTERSHVRKLKVLDSVFYQRLSRDGVLSADDLRSIFSNLQEIIQLHVGLSEQMAALRRRSESPVLGPIGDDLLTWFSGEEELRMKQQVALFCSNLPLALELIRTRQKKDQRFASFMQEAESNRLCRRLQLKDIIPVEMQRLTKYPLLLDNIAKYTDDMEERRRVKRASDSCKKILNHINQAVKEAENAQRLREYQRRLDLSSLKQSENPTVLEIKNLDLSQKSLVHEGPLSWKLTKDKAIEMYSLLLEDILVLLQKQDERLVLKLHGKTPTSAESKQIFSPVIRLSSVLVRPVATDHRSFFVLSMADNVAQIYELTAPTISDQRTWQRMITQSADSIKARLHSRDSVVSQSDGCAVCVSEEQRATKIITLGLSHTKDSIPSAGDAQGSDVPVEETIARTLSELKSEKKEEEVAELEAFLEGHLAKRLDQESHKEDICNHLHQDTQEEIICNHLHMSRSKAEEALRTLSMLKQLLLNHMARDTFSSAKTTQQEVLPEQQHLEDTPPHEENTHLHPEERPPVYPENPPIHQNHSPIDPAHHSAHPEEQPSHPEHQPAHPEHIPAHPEHHPSDPVHHPTHHERHPEHQPANPEHHPAHPEHHPADLEHLPAHSEPPEEPGSPQERPELLEQGLEQRPHYNGVFDVLDLCGPEDGSTEEDVGIDMTKLLSSSSQTEGAGPNLSRQVMTHLRLLQQDLHYLKEVEARYRQLQQSLSDTTDSDDCTDFVV